MLTKLTLAATAAVVGLAAIAWVGLGKHASAHKLPTTSNSVIECNSRDPLSACAAHSNVGYPIGDGLFYTPMEDFF